MNRANGKGVSISSADAPKTHEFKHADFTTDDGVGKAFDTLRARLEMCGCGLHEMADRSYFVSCGSLSRQLPDLRAVRQMLVQIGGRA